MPQASPQPAPPSSGITYNLATIAVLILLAALGLAYAIDNLGRSNSLPQLDRNDTRTVTQTVAGRTLSIPRSWFRAKQTDEDEFSQQVDLRFALDITGAQSPIPVDVTLLPMTRARASTALLDTVYARQFDDTLLQTIPGLVGKPLKPTDGYSEEVVWYDALAPRPFVAKCSNAPVAEQVSQCIRTVHLASGLAAIVTFNDTALTHWREFDSQVALWLDQIGAL